MCLTGLRAQYQSGYCRQSRWNLLPTACKQSGYCIFVLEGKKIRRKKHDSSQICPRSLAVRGSISISFSSFFSCSTRKQVLFPLLWSSNSHSICLTLNPTAKLFFFFFWIDRDVDLISCFHTCQRREHCTILHLSVSDVCVSAVSACCAFLDLFYHCAEFLPSPSPCSILCTAFWENTAHHFNSAFFVSRQITTTVAWSCCCDFLTVCVHTLTLEAHYILSQAVRWRPVQASSWSDLA